MSSYRNHVIRSHRNHKESYRGASALKAGAIKSQAGQTARKSVASRIKNLFRKKED